MKHLKFTPPEAQEIFPLLRSIVEEQEAMYRFEVRIFKGEKPGSLSTHFYLSAGGKLKLLLQVPGGSKAMLLEACDRCRLGTPWDQHLSCTGCGQDYSSVLMRRKGGFRLIELGESPLTYAEEAQAKVEAACDEWLTRVTDRDPLTIQLHAQEFAELVGKLFYSAAIAERSYGVALLSRALVEGVHVEVVIKHDS